MSLNIEPITQVYESQRGLHESLQQEIVFEIRNALDQSDIKYHSIVSRIKTLDSLFLKMEGKNVKNISEISDVVGARIVTLFLSDIHRIIDVLKKIFDVKLTDNKIDGTDPELFGYFSVHVHAKIKQSFAGTRYDKIKEMMFEVQVRTIAMDAWAAASHYLDYKSDADIPADLRRDFNALSGLFYVADKHFETFFRSRTAKIKRIDRAFKDDKPPLHVALDLDTFTAFLRDRYPDRKKSSSREVSLLLAEVRSAGFNDLASLIAKLDETENDFKKYEQRRMERSHNKGQTGRFVDVGVVRVSLFTNFLEGKALPPRTLVT